MLESVLPRQDLVLVGAGHAHVQVLRRWMMSPEPGVRLTLVVDRPIAIYSGMVPGWVAGDYRAEELEIDVIPLARRAGARVVLAAATRIDPVARVVHVGPERPPIAWDVCSVDVGSTVAGLDLPGVREFAVATRPIGRFVSDLDRRFSAEMNPQPAVAVVGLGAGGVELAFTVQARLKSQGARPTVTLLGRGELLPGYGQRPRASVRRHLLDRGIVVEEAAAVREVREGSIERDPGGSLETNLVLWVAGAAPPPLLGNSPGLPLDARGFLRVDQQLQVPGFAGLFACGDCSSIDGHSWVPKAGVYAVRAGPVLDINLRAALAGRALKRFAPQRHFLSLLNLGEGIALGSRGARVFHGRAAWRLKDVIDRRFMRRFQVLDGKGNASAFPSPEEMGMTDMPCGGCAAKVQSSVLAEALAALPRVNDAQVIVGMDRPDDVSAIRTASGATLLCTVDAFRAFTDDPFLVARVAAINALSDVWAKGGKPRFAQLLLTVPEGPEAQVKQLLEQLLRGAHAALTSHKVTLTGGHTTLGTELCVGFSILGEPGSRYLPKAALEAGQVLVLTKPLGTGALLHADMMGCAEGRWVTELHRALLESNAAASAVALEFATACTDVTGFGLAGHLLEMLQGELVADVDLSALPALPGALESLSRGFRSTYHGQNRRNRERMTLPRENVGVPRVELLFDPQTSGGLLFGVPMDRAEEVAKALPVTRIGRVRHRLGSEPRLQVR